MKELLYRTVLQNIYDYKFLFSNLIVIILFIFGSFISIHEISSYRKEYQELTSVAEREKNLENIKIIKKPNKFIFIHNGAEKSLPNYLIVLPDFVDYPIEDVSLKPFIDYFQTLDWFFIIGFLLSLLVLFMTYDSVSGEKEKGTLKLLFSHHLEYSTFLLSKFLGSLSSLIPFMLFGFLLSLAILLIHDVPIEMNDLPPILLVIILSIFYIGVLTLTGIFSSTLSSKSSTTLIICLFVWFFIVVIIPNSSILISQIISPIPSFKEFSTQLQSAEKRFLSKVTISNLELRKIYIRKDLSNAEKKTKVAQLQQKLYKEHLESLKTFKQELLKIREDYIKKLEKQLIIARTISKMSPFSLYKEAIEQITGTGYYGHKRFLTVTTEYMKEYTLFVNHMREKLSKNAKIIGPKIVDEGYEIQGISWISFKDVKFEKHLIPKCPDYKYSFFYGLNRALSDIGLLIFFGIFFFIFSYLRILYYDVR